MYWLELSGVNQDGARRADNIGSPFLSIEAAVEKATQLADANTFHWGKATLYRIKDESGCIVQEGPI